MYEKLDCRTGLEDRHILKYPTVRAHILQSEIVRTFFSTRQLMQPIASHRFFLGLPFSCSQLSFDSSLFMSSLHPFYAPYLFFFIARQANPGRPRRCSIPLLLLFFTFFAARCAQAQNSTTVSIVEIGGGATTLQNNSVRTSAENNSCIVVGCDSRISLAEMNWWDFYSKTEYVTTQIHFDGILYRGKPVSPNWCRIPSVVHELERFPGSRVLYIDTETRVNYTHWCNTSPRALGPKAPIIVNSVYRNRSSRCMEHRCKRIFFLLLRARLA